MRTVAIIQARMGSTRLPGKVLLPLAGKPMLWHVVERARAVTQVDEVVVATTVDSTDDAIRDYCSTSGIQVMSGSEMDVVDRFLIAARDYDADPVVRVTADCPLMDVRVVERVIETFHATGADHVGAVSGSGARAWGLAGFPEGIGATCVSRQALEQVWLDADNTEDREHVTTYIIRHPELFQSHYIVPDVDLSELRLTVDEPEDLKLMDAILSGMGCDPRTNLASVVGFLDANPEIAQGNREFVGRERYRHIWEETGGPERSVSVFEVGLT